ncbi:MAG TPA: MBL fold metallo-hydrolase [Steroidobacteraceae bacterium]|jgi:glyoxylase-like metal-dependent hydrolase (beta-lactamase superfamily II)|nr:MBL fold metallo-hydrolase [Steroidobacteraceae bacterium]
MAHSDRQAPATVPVQPTLYRHPHGITAVDAEYLYSGHAAAHIIVDGGRAAFVDVGTNNSVPYLLAALSELGVPRAAVDYVLLTHVHLDHAGGAGTLMAELPNARAVLHPRGALHMSDPSRLIAGARAVYGEERFARLYGELVPIAPARVRVVQDGERLRLGERELEFLHARGHAEHHYVVVDAAHASIFSGDTFGISYRALETPKGAFITPSTVPTQFDPEQHLASIDRMLAYHPESVYLMHFSRVTGVPRLAEMLKAQIREFVRFTRAHAEDADPSPGIRTAMLAHWVSLLRLQGSALPAADIEQALRGDLELNTQGLIAWLQREKRK